MKRLVFILVAPFLIAISIMPFWLIYLCSDIFYLFTYYIVRYRKEVVRKNLILSGLASTEKELKKMERSFYKYLCDLFLEIIKVRGMSKKEMLRRFTMTNPEVAEQYAKKNKSIFVMAGHYANFEWLLSIGHHITHTPHAIYAPLMNPYFDKYIQWVRSKHGSYLISRKKFTEQFKKLQDSNALSVVGFAADQSPRRHAKNYHLSFLGQEVPVFTGAERLGKEFDVPVLMAKVRRIKRGYYETTLSVLAESPKTVPDYQITDAFYAELESLIKEDPSLYFWTHNRFKLMRQKQQ